MNRLRVFLEEHITAVMPSSLQTPKMSALLVWKVCLHVFLCKYRSHVMVCVNIFSLLAHRAEYTPENPQIITKCSHHFHLSCIYEWMERSDTCPICGKVGDFVLQTLYIPTKKCIMSACLTARIICWDCRKWSSARAPERYFHAGRIGKSGKKYLQHGMLEPVNNTVVLCCLKPVSFSRPTCVY